MARTNHISTSASSYSFLDSQNTGDSVFSKDTTIGTTEQLTNSPLFLLPTPPPPPPLFFNTPTFQNRNSSPHTYFAHEDHSITMPLLKLLEVKIFLKATDLEKKAALCGTLTFHILL